MRRESRRIGLGALAVAAIMVLAFIPLVAPAHAAVSFVQYKHAIGINTTQATCSMSGVTAGYFIAVVATYNVGVVNVQDNGSNNYILQVSAGVDSADWGAYAVIYTTSARASVGGHLGITITWASQGMGPGATSEDGGVCLMYSGVLSPTAAHTDTGTGTVNSGTVTSAATGSFTPGGQNLVISGAFMPNCGTQTGLTTPFASNVLAGRTFGDYSIYCNAADDVLEESFGASYTVSSAGTATTTPWTATGTDVWDGTVSANWAVASADFTVSTYTSTTTSTVTSTQTVCTSTVTSYATSTTTTTSTTTSTVTG